MNINELIQDAKTIGIAGHIRPDGDCIGSCIALYNYLLLNRPELDVNVHLEYVDDKYSLLDNIQSVKTHEYDGTIYDLFISLDTASPDRLGRNLEFFNNAKRTVCIDHHKSNKGYADYNVVKGEASSACEVLYGFLKDGKFDKTVAKPMYMGMATDSGVFRFQQTTPDTLRIAADMMAYGIDHNEILETVYFAKTYNQMLVTSIIQSNSVVVMDGKAIYGYCTRELMDEYGITTNDLDAVIASIRNVSGVEVAMFAYQLEDNRYKVSLRSKKYVDVSEIAVLFGGGGHVRAAGFDLEGSKDEVIEKVLREIEKRI